MPRITGHLHFDYFSILLPMNEGKTPHIIPPLTGVRFLAVLFVFLYHYNPFHNSHSVIGNFLEGVFDQLYIGVSIFFVLSGFLIAYNYFESSSISTAFFRKYMIRRVARIYPLYFTITTAYFIYWKLRHEGGDHLFGVYLLNISFIRGFSQKFFTSGIFQGWSLTVEETFYLLAPFIFYFIRRRFFLSQIVIFFFVGGLLVGFFTLFPFQGFFSDLRFLFVGTFFGRCFEFFIGVALALAVKGNKLPLNNAGKSFTTFGMVGIIFCILLMKEVCTYFGVSAALNHPLGIITHNFILPFFVAMFFYGLIAEKTIVRRFFSASLTVELGKSSYAFYLVHAGLIAYAVLAYTNNIFVIFLVLQLFSVALYHLFELPANKFIRKIFSSSAEHVGHL